MLSAVGTIAAIAAIVAFDAVNRRGLDTLMMHERTGTGLTAKAPREPVVPEPLAANRRNADADATEAEPPTGAPTPAPTNDQRERPATVDARSRPVAPAKDIARDLKKRPDPVPEKVPRFAATLSPATYEGTPCFRGHRGAVGAVAVSSDGKLALSAGSDHYARLWNIRTGGEISAAHHPSDVFDAALSGDGRFALTCTKGVARRNGAVRLWNMSTSTAKLVFGSDRWRVGSINAVALFGNGRALSGGQDGQLVLWNLNTGTRVRKAGQQKDYIHSHGIAFFPRGVRAATGGGDGLVHIWDLGRGEEVATWEGHRGAISSIAISRDGSKVVSGGSDGTVILWETRSGSVLRSFKMPDGDRNARVAILPDGNVLAAGEMRGQLVLWNANAGLVLRQSKGPFVRHFGLAVLPDGERVLTADQDGIVRMWVPRP
jgi:WD40 repeat protein